jgi:hypothetical protein
MKDCKSITLQLENELGTELDTARRVAAGDLAEARVTD